MTNDTHPLKVYRLTNGMSLGDFSAVSGMSKFSICRIETGKYQPTADNIRTIVFETGGAVTANDLLGIKPVKEAAE